MTLFQVSMDQKWLCGAYRILHPFFFFLFFFPLSLLVTSTQALAAQNSLSPLLLPFLLYPAPLVIAYFTIVS